MAEEGGYHVVVVENVFKSAASGIFIVFFMEDRLWAMVIVRDSYLLLLEEDDYWVFAKEDMCCEVAMALYGV